MINLIKNFFEFFLISFFFLFSKFIGLRLSSFSGGMIFLIFGFFSNRNKLAISNLNRIFPKKSIKEKKKIIRKMWFHFGRIIGEYPHLKKIKVFENSNIDIKNLQNLINPLKKNKNCIFFSAHLGNWELTSHPLTQSGFKIHFIYRAPNNKYVEWLLRKIRLDYGVNLIKKGQEGAKDCIKALKNNESLGMLIDQKMNDGIQSKFFGTNVMTAPAIAKLALKFKCSIIPAVCTRIKGTKFKIEYFEQIEYKKLREIKNENEILSYLNKYIERWIKKNPEQWLWIHNRW
ncbi:MAG: lauroyl acyltransferase [Rickettsiales bacterium]|nr:lauroyl acyltransferase [Rickettsiales bacterium]|tara:strand:+ start:760 stop:1623 length:864 start_codon:yes stop_codon:yes gene_type:complete